MAKLNPSKKQIEYWTARNEKMFLNGERDILEYAKSLKRKYINAADQIEQEIQKFYGKFAVDNNYTMVELKKLLNRDELKSFKNEVANMVDYMKMHFDDKDYVQNLKLLRAKSRISRLEELKTRINFEVEKLYNDVNDSLGEQLQKSFEDGYYQTIFNQQQFLGFSSNFAMLNTKAIETAVKTNYMTENYSDVLWKNKTNLMNILNQQIPQGIILGYNPRKVANIASKQLGSKYNSTVRLVRTEYNLILNDATAQGYKEAGIEKYQLLATLDSRTSDICREMDGEIFKVKEKEVGINYPPFHPNCRTTTIPYFEPDEFDTEIEQYIKDEDGIKHKITDDTQYEEWKNALKPKKDGTAIYENNMTKTEAKQELSMPQIEAIKKYTYANNNMDEVSSNILSNTIIQSGDVTGDINLYRMVSLDELGIKFKELKQNANAIINKEIIAKNFLSTAKEVSGTYGFNGHLIKITGVQNTKGLDISKWSVKPNELEVLFNKGTTYKITKCKPLYDADGDFMNFDIEAIIIK